MGNCFGKTSTSSGQSSGGNFHGQGRTLGGPTPATAPPTTGPTRASVPANVTISGQTSGGGGDYGTLGGTATIVDDPKTAAARAAEERAKANPSKGKLGRALDAQKSQTQAGTLAQNARDNIAARDADAAARVQTWD